MSQIVNIPSSDIQQVDVITDLSGVTSLTTTGASINYKDPDSILVSVTIKELSKPMQRVLHGNQVRLGEIIASEVSMPAKIDLLVKEAVASKDFK